MFSGCRTGVKFDPDYYVADHTRMEFFNEDGLIRYCGDPIIEDGAYLTKEKIMELAEILKRARMPNKKIKKLLPIRYLDL